MKSKGKILQPTLVDGHLTVDLQKDGVNETVPVHELVAAAFLGPCPEGMVVCHRNGNKLDNSVSNLCYGVSDG